MIPRLKPHLGLKELKGAFHYPKRDDVSRFETKFAHLMGQRNAIAFPYGRTGLIYLLKALGLQGKEVICPAYTCVVVPHAVVYSGNKPVFIDCEQNSYNMDLDKVEQAINSNTGAIVATSLFGYPVNLDRLNQIQIRYPGIHIIQDCAHSFGAYWKGGAVHREGIAALFAFNISKMLTAIFGGMITTDDDQLMKRLRRSTEQELIPARRLKGLRRLLYFLAIYPAFSKPFYGVVNRMERSGILNGFVRYYDELKVDMPHDYLENITGVEARVGTANLSRYHSVVSNRQAAAKYYFRHLGQVADSRPEKKRFLMPPQIEGATYSHFVIQVSDRRLWLQKGIELGVQLGGLIEYNIPEMKPYGGRRPEEFPVSAQYSRRSVNLPVWGGEKVARKTVNLLQML